MKIPEEMKNKLKKDNFFKYCSNKLKDNKTIMGLVKNMDNHLHLQNKLVKIGAFDVQISVEGLLELLLLIMKESFITEI